MLISFLIFACGGDDDDAGDDDAAPADPLQTCIDETMRLFGPDGCLYPGTNTQDDIEQACSQSQASAGDTECGTEAYQEMVDCLQAIDCSDQDMAGEDWISCASNFENDLVNCA